MLRWSRFSPLAVGGLGLILLVGVAIVSRSAWMPPLKAQVLAWAQSGVPADAPHAGHEHDHGHEHGHDESASIEVTPQGLKNIGYRPVKVALGTYPQTLRLPAMVVEQPGRTQIQVAAPMTGVVTRVAAREGVAVEPGSLLFSIRLMHEELVTAQRDFLRTAESLDVVNREIARLRSLSEGLVAGKRIIDEEYERQKLEASQRAEQQGLLLHGLTEPQIADIQKTRKLLQSLDVRAPQHSHDEPHAVPDHLFHVQKLNVRPGQHVEAGDPLCVLADHCGLLVEGRAFEDDAEPLRRALEAGWSVTAHVMSGGREASSVEGLRLLYFADHVDAESRAFHFYLSLANEVATDRTTPEGARYLHWRFRPGQRLEVEVTVAAWEKRIVLPVSAIVDEGAEAYVFRQSGDRFDRVAIHVEHRDRSSVVVANDGALFPGEVVAAKGAYQLQLALRNKSGGAVDPHAGHNH